MKKLAKVLMLCPFLLLLSTSAFGLYIDFTDSDKFVGVVGNQTFTTNVGGLDVTLISVVATDNELGGPLTFNSGDGIGIDGEYEYDEIEWPEMLIVEFSTPVYLSRIDLLDFFWENLNPDKPWYEEKGSYGLKHGPNPSDWDSSPTYFSQTDHAKTIPESLGEFSITLNDPLVYAVRFSGLGYIYDSCGNMIENNELALAGLDVRPVPEPTTLLLLGTGLVGLVGFRKRFRKR